MGLLLIEMQELQGKFCLLQKHRGLTSVGCVVAAMSLESLVCYSDFREDTVRSQSILDSDCDAHAWVGGGPSLHPSLTTGSAQGVLGLTS